MKGKIRFGALPFYALETMARMEDIKIPTTGKEMVVQGLIHAWQCGPNGELSPFALLHLKEATQVH